nr:hypothetical protein [Tanacetum cinerariifolium]
MSNISNNMKTQTSNTLHNAIMEAGSKDRPSMLAPGIDNNIYSRVDDCPNACEMWKAIERLKQGESINVQDPETNLFWEFGKFTSQDGESLESYSLRFYKMMNELTRNQCKVTNHQVNVQFLLQLQPEWQRFVTIVKQSQELKNVSYHKLYDILKQHQHEVNEIQAEKIARVANPLALIAQQQPVYHPQTHPTHYNQNSSTRSQQAATRNRGKAIANSPQPIYDQEPFMVADDDETSKDKEIDKLMALISLLFKKIYKPTNNNLRTSSNTSRANQDNSPRIHRNDGYEHQRLGNIARARETVGSSVVQKYGIQCYNCKEYGHVARECQKPKRAKDAVYHREKMLLCKQEEAGIQLNAEQADWKDDTDDESDDQELEAHSMYMAKLQQVSLDVVDSRPIFDKEPEQKVQTDDHYDVFAIELDMNYDSEQIDQNDEDVDLTKEQANNKLSKENDLLYTDFKKSKAKLKRRDSIEYASEMELACAKVREMKTKLSAHQDTISILKQQKDAQIKLYKSCEDKEIEKVIALENKVKVLDNIVYKPGQTVQTMNMFNNKCRTSFIKPEYLKKAKQANPRLYDIGCYNDNLALMLSPDLMK